MRKPVILITGANGEMGHGLIEHFSHNDQPSIIAIDLNPLDARLEPHCLACIVGDILDQNLLQRLVSEFEIHAIYHLAALLSTRSEYTPETAHEVNVGGTIHLLKLAAEQARSHGRQVKFIFPSSIAAYGLPNLETKAKAGAVTEDQFTTPHTMYGCNKLYCETLGRYYAKFYRWLAQDRVADILDFRCLRFPGLISAETLPTGGTSDFVPEMIHAAAEGKAYACFVRPDTRIPFMTMPDAIEALRTLAAAEAQSLSRCVYNVTSFSPSAGEVAELVKGHFPRAQITFAPDAQRQAIVDSWPAETDDSAARRDWAFKPRHDLAKAFEEYLVPAIRARYA